MIDAPTTPSGTHAPDYSGYRSYYLWIFSFFYFVQGMVQGIPSLVFPVYIADVLGSYDIARGMIMAFYGNIPWTVKFLVGLGSDRWGSAKWGRRFPWIFTFGTIGAIFWVYVTIAVPRTDGVALYDILTISWFFTSIGMAFADVSLDGMILDVTPKDQMATVQSRTWAVMLVGMAAGPVLLGYIFLTFNIMPMLFLLTGVLMFFSCFFPHWVHEPAFERPPPLGKTIWSYFTKKKSYTLFGFTIFSAIPGALLVTFFGYLILYSMDIIDVTQTLLSITSGNTTDLLGWGVLIYGANGVGTFIGSLLIGKVTDRSRKRGMNLMYLVFFPMIFASNIFIGLILGIIGQIILGAAQGAQQVVTSTIKSDMVRKEYADLKSFFYSLLLSLWNLGLSIASLIGGWCMAWFAGMNLSFPLIYFYISLISAALLAISYLFFLALNPRDYEFTPEIQVGFDQNA
jgi:MFS family permease